MTYKWTIHQSSPIDSELLDLAQGDSLVARLLNNRSVNTFGSARYFLALNQVSESSSFEIPEINKAFERIKLAIDSNQHILIYGDYDVDGTSSAALLVRAFKMIGVKAAYYIPNRHSEGYGLNKDAVQKFKHGNYGSIDSKPVDLLITCDCGISNYAEVEFANEIGLDVIVTDHHSLPENPPPSIANCNPKTLPEEHPLHYLPGVGVAYKLAEVILDHYIEDKVMAGAYKLSLLDLVALGMIADLAPLRAENRLLVKQGLKVLAQTEKPGLQELMKVCGVNMDPNAEHIGFGIAPRINAAGRLADAKQAVELMITEDFTVAQELAEDLDTSNKERQRLCDETLEDALDILSQEFELDPEALCIAIAKEGWNHGVIGIVASRLVEKFHLPVFIMAIEEGIAKGSVRGINIPDLDIFEEMNIIQKETNLFVKYGGHKMAAGFSCKLEDKEKLISTIKDHFKQRLANSDIRKIVKIDSALKLREVNSGFISRIEKIAPFGMENPQPIFISGPLQVSAMRTLGQEGKHIKLYLKEKADSKPTEAVIWNRAQEFLETYGSKINPEITIVYTPKINDFRGERFIQLDIRDWKDPQNVEPEFFARFNKALV